MSPGDRPSRSPWLGPRHPSVYLSTWKCDVLCMRVLSSKLKPLHSGVRCHSLSLSAPSRGPAPRNACPRAAGGRATATPRGAGTARGPPAALPAAKRTAKGKGALRASSRAPVPRRLLSPEPRHEVPGLHAAGSSRGTWASPEAAQALRRQLPGAAAGPGPRQLPSRQGIGTGTPGPLMWHGSS